MNTSIQEHRNYGFALGLLTGTFAGAGLMMWLAPRSTGEVRQRVTDSARRVGQRATDQFQQASTRAAEAVDEATRKGQAVRDEVADAVARGAHEVERFATASKTDRAAEGRKHIG